MRIELSDKALQTILAKDLTTELPDIQYFKRPITLCFKNLLGTSEKFEQAFIRYLNPTAGQVVAEKLKKESLVLDLKRIESDQLYMRLYQQVDLSECLPQDFKDSSLTTFNYLEVKVGDSFQMTHNEVLSSDRVYWFTQLLILIAYDTLNHLKSPIRTILVPASQVRQTKKDLLKKQVTKTPKSSVYYYKGILLKYETTVHRVSKKPILRKPSERFFLKTEWERRGIEQCKKNYY